MQRRLEHPEPEGGGDIAVGLTSFDNVAEMLEEFILQTVAPGRPDAAFVQRRKRAGLDVALVSGCSVSRVPSAVARAAQTVAWDDSEKSAFLGCVTPVSAGHCGSHVLPGRDERVSSNAGAQESAANALARA